MSHNKTFIIAEAGVNHNGSLEMALQMVDTAVAAGADAVKFQTFKAEKIITDNAPKARYQEETMGADESQLEMVSKLELNEVAHVRLYEHCQEKGVQFLSSPFDLESIDLLYNLGLEILKIPSGDLTNLPYLRKIGQLQKQIVLSTGMANLGEIEDALEILERAGTPRDKITVMHCNTEYPTPMSDVNLRAMQTIKAAFPGVRVGYSDHTLGIEVPIAAVAMGARLIEKHFTLDRNMEGPDHKASVTSEELKSMVTAIRNIEKAMGSSIKKPSLSELKNIPIVRKSLVAEKPILKGEVFTEENLTAKRPGTGINPMRWDEVLGQVAQKDYEKDELI